jgi:hypothetical protein
LLLREAEQFLCLRHFRCAQHETGVDYVQNATLVADNFCASTALGLPQASGSRAGCRRPDEGSASDGRTCPTREVAMSSIFAAAGDSYFSPF